MATVELTNKLTDAIDENKITAGIFLDLSKAFDTVDHSILISKLEHYGIRDLALDWIKYQKQVEYFVKPDTLYPLRC